jgi:hypothetical protein
MPLSQYLQDRYTELQRQYNLLTEELEDLYQSKRTDDLSPGGKFKLKQQIKEVEAERETITQKLTELDQKTRSEQLYRTMLKLGYQRQVELFIKLVQAQSVAAFLIHGSPQHGQRWLLNRLVTDYIPNSLTGKKLQIDLIRRGRQIDISTLWRELGSKVMRKGWLLSPSQIVERVYQWRKTQNVLLVFHDVDFIPEDCLRILLCDFWKPLVHQAQQTSSLQSKYKLLMFLVDYEGNVGSLETLFTETIDPNQPDNPLKSPKINRFSKKELTDWIIKDFGELPIELTYKYEDTVQVILEESNQGIPDYVLQGIFERCGFNYHEEIKNLWKV